MSFVSLLFEGFVWGHHLYTAGKSATLWQKVAYNVASSKIQQSKFDRLDAFITINLKAGVVCTMDVYHINHSSLRSVLLLSLPCLVCACPIFVWVI